MAENMYWISNVVLTGLLILICMNDIRIKVWTGAARSYKQLINYCIYFFLQDMLWGLCYAGVIRNDVVFTISSALFHLSAVTMTFFWLKYVMDFIGDRIKGRKIYLILDVLVISLEICLIVRNFITPTLFSIADGNYVPEKYRPFTFFTQFFIYCIIIILTLFFGVREKGKEREKFFAVFFFTLAPVLLGVFQLLYPESPFYSLAYFIGCFIIHLFIQSKDRELTLQDQNLQLEEITKLNRSLSEYSDAMSKAGYGMWHIILKDGTEPRMQVNEKMAELLGIAGQDLTEEQLYNAWYGQIVPEAIPSVQASVGEMIAGHFSENTYKWIHPQKGEIYVRCGGTAVKLEDGTNLLSGYHTDVTDIVAKEKKYTEELENARKAAEDANAAKSTFLFNMSHDIRTPMNAIIGYTDLIEKHYDDKEKCMDYLSKMKQANGFLLSLINDVLEMARIESGKTKMEEAVSPVGGIARELSAIFEDQMAAKGIKYTCTINTHTAYAFYDNAKIREIYLNILSNALKYTPEGGSVTMQVDELPEREPGYIWMKAVFSDTGIGMSEEFIPHIFEDFTRERTATESRQQGTGLGMPIVKKILDMMGGTIEVKSKLGEGTTFTVTYPLKVEGVSEAAKAAEDAVEAAETAADFAGRRILLAEDNDFNAEIATEILTEAGFKVDRAEDGKICVEKLMESEKGYYDVILMDVQMPNMNGYEATRNIRNLDDKNKADTVIIAMTANAFEEDKKESLASGMNGHLAKPINVSELIKTLTRVLG